MAKRKREEFTPEQEEAAKDLDIAAALEAVALSEGGKILANGLLKDVISDVDTLSARYKDLTMQEFVGVCADMKSKLDQYRALVRAGKTKQALQEFLKEMLGE